MRKFLAAVVLTLFMLSLTPLLAQNPTCPTRPTSDSSNACASTAFVHNLVGTPLPAVGSMSSLRALSPGAYPAVYLMEYYSGSGTGNGIFLWNSTSTAVDNNGATIAPNAGGTGRWIRQTEVANRYSPEMFGARADGTSDANPIDDLMAYLTTIVGSGRMQFSCGRIYTLAMPTGTGPYGARGNGLSLIRTFSNIDIGGCGRGSGIKMANNVNTSSTFFAFGIANTTTANNVVFENFDIDMNAVGNSCGGTCYHSNAAIRVDVGDSITVQNVLFKNNPGSNNTVFGSNVEPPTVTNLHLIGNIHEHNALSANPAMLDWSGDFFIATNVVYSNVTHSDATGGTAFEMHGTNISASNISVTDHVNCGIIASEPAGAASVTKGLVLSTVTCNNVKNGLQIAAKAGATTAHISVEHLVFNYLAGFSGISVDACNLMDAASTGNINLSIRDITHNSTVTTNLGNEAPVVTACRWTNTEISGVFGTNSQGPAVVIDNVIANAHIGVNNVRFSNPGRTGTAANQVGVRFINTSGNTASIINIANVTTTGTLQYNISGNVNATQTTIDQGSLGAGVSVAHINWTGTGVSSMIFPQAVTNFRGTGGASQVVKQTTAGGAFSVAQLTYADIGGTHNAYSSLTFNTGNAANPCLQNATWFFTTAQCYSTEANASAPAPQASTLDKLYCTCGTAPPAGQTYTVTLRKNGADSTVTCQFTNGGGTTCNDTTHSATYVAGDTFSLKLVNSVTSGTPTISCGLRATFASP